MGVRYGSGRYEKEFWKDGVDGWLDEDGGNAPDVIVAIAERMGWADMVLRVAFDAVESYSRGDWLNPPESDLTVMGRLVTVKPGGESLESGAKPTEVTVKSGEADAVLGLYEDIIEAMALDGDLVFGDLSDHRGDY